jgi:hypothetical protein
MEKVDSDCLCKKGIIKGRWRKSREIEPMLGIVAGRPFGQANRRAGRSCEYGEALVVHQFTARQRQCGSSSILL